MFRSVSLTSFVLGPLLVAVVATAGRAAPIPNLHNTGEAGVGGLDANYTFGANQSSLVVNTLPGDYAPPLPGSNWISQARLGNNDPMSVLPNLAAGPSVLYTYTNKFDLTGFQPNTVALSFSMASDNGTVVKLNGATVFTLPGGTGDASSYNVLHAVSIGVGSNFIAGINTLLFEVTNSPPSADNNYNPQALVVTGIQGTGTPTTGLTVPEPASLAMWLLVGAAGCLGRMRMVRRGALANRNGK